MRSVRMVKSKMKRSKPTHRQSYDMGFVDAEMIKDGEDTYDLDIKLGIE